MPPKKKKGGRKKGSKDTTQATLERDSLVRTCRNFLKAYTQRCQTAKSAPSPRVTRDAKTLLEEDKALEKFILEPSLSVPAAASADPPPSRQPTKPAASYPIAAPAGVPMSANSRIASTTEGGAPGRRYPILVQTLVEAWCNANYKFMRALHVWHLELPDEEVVALALFMESPLGANLMHLELVNGNISPWGHTRLAKSLKTCHLTNLHLDYNSIPVDCLANMCIVLQKDAALQVLSIRSCHLTASCGEALGTLAVLSGLRELYLDNNLLECEGATELFKLIAAFSENPAFPKLRLAKLCMQNNAIDENGKLGSLGPEVCMQLVKRWIVNSSDLIELDFDRNYIGDGGGKEIMEAMLQRKEAGLADFRMTVTPRMSCQIFSSIVELSATLGGSKGKKKKRQKRKKGR